MTLQDLGIAVSAVASTVLVGIQVARFFVERSHLVVRLSVGEPDPESPQTAWVSAAVFNRGRAAFIDGLWLHVGKDKWFIGGEAKGEGQELPFDLATGRSYRLGFSLERYEVEMLQEADGLGYKLTYTDNDLLQMRLRVTDGEGHDHWADLTKDSVPHVRALVDERKHRRREREEKRATVAKPKDQ